MCIRDRIQLPGWDTSYQPDALKALLAEYSKVDEETLWSHLEYFLHKVIPVAKEVGIKMAKMCIRDRPWTASRRRCARASR